MFERLMSRVKSLFAKVSLPKIQLPKITIPKLTLPKFSLPKISLPKVTLPKFNLPKIQLPKLKFPKLNLGPVTTAFKAVLAFLGRGMSKFLGNWKFLLIALIIIAIVGLGGFQVGQRELTMGSINFSSSPTTVTMEVTGNKVNVRPCPGTTCQAVGALHNGDIVEVLERVAGDNGDEWCKISFKNVDAYVACKLLEVKGE